MAGEIIKPFRAAAAAAAAAVAACFLLAGCGGAQPASTAPGRPAGSSGVAGVAGGPAGLASLATVPVVDKRQVSSPAARTYLGAVGGTRALIGLVVDGARARAYLCDGTRGRIGTLSEWFAGPVRGGTFAAVSPQHRVRLDARLTGPAAAGTVTLADGRASGFAVPLVAYTRLIGVFQGAARARGRSYPAGWIILPDRETRGAINYRADPASASIIVIGIFPPGPI